MPTLHPGGVGCARATSHLVTPFLLNSDSICDDHCVRHAPHYCSVAFGGRSSFPDSKAQFKFGYPNVMFHNRLTDRIRISGHLLTPLNENESVPYLACVALYNPERVGDDVSCHTLNSFAERSTEHQRCIKHTTDMTRTLIKLHILKGCKWYSKYYRKIM